jgi:hypothetical protein
MHARRQRPERHENHGRAGPRDGAAHRVAADPQPQPRPAGEAEAH